MGGLLRLCCYAVINTRRYRNSWHRHWVSGKTSDRSFWSWQLLIMGEYWVMSWERMEMQGGGELDCIMMCIITSMEPWTKFASQLSLWTVHGCSIHASHSTIRHHWPSPTLKPCISALHRWKKMQPLEIDFHVVLAMAQFLCTYQVLSVNSKYWTTSERNENKFPTFFSGKVTAWRWLAVELGHNCSFSTTTV